ncbi:hypothetical protein HK096_003906 [Nowakowskiella sp. JEL0078]|nr:hypothetical protein HK096_003906 [Nowakowskiella sp. JEL0078]
MKVLLIGAGGREHAIATALLKSKSVSKIYLVPGNGAELASDKLESVALSQSNFPELVKFAVDNSVDLVVPGPEQPLVDGIESWFRKVGISVFGPSARAAHLEGSKAFSKEFMMRHGIPTAAFKTFTDFEKAVEYVRNVQTPIVIKASGLAAGKGVVLPNSVTESEEYLKEIIVDKIFGDAGLEVVIEERLEGEEVSVLAFSDGHTVVAMPPAQDHKRAYNGDQGPNTGGMGAYAPTPIMTDNMLKQVHKSVLQATVDGMRKDGVPFVGVLYAGLMLTKTGIKVLEFNCRFGDPETQVILPLLDDSCDLAEIFLACAESRLDSVSVKFKSEFACTVVAASNGYPGSYQKGKEITLVSSYPSNVHVFQAGTKLIDGILKTDGGRVFSVTAVSPTLESAIATAYENMRLASFEGMQFRTDIGHRALSYKKTQLTYKSAGVDVDAGNALVEKIKPFVRATKRSGTDSELGGFGGLFDLAAAGYTDGVLVSGTDGVGTKLKIAQEIGCHTTIGIDLVAMNVNDVLVQGAEPLFFLDYFATGGLDVDVAADVIKGIARGCEIAGCALVGGETSEMPGMYASGDYDLAGFVVGAVDRKKILPTLDRIVEGDVLVGVASSGIHSNGYSLVRHIVENLGVSYDSPPPFKSVHKTLGEALLEPTRIYVKEVLPVAKSGLIKSMAHITGGGFTENVPRALPKEFGVIIDARTFEFLDVFRWLKKVGNISNAEFARTFNCGIGLVLVVAKENVADVIRLLKENGEKKVYEIGKIVKAVNGERK